ncbi:MAG: hypothetical protein IKN55_05485 [Oscillospiraceae bacterium]|nr:hypothetical protein [Oscillospiraceae bacterium]
MLDKKQIAAVRWYTGDVEGTDPFWGDPKAYVGINALFFPGITTERMRAAEGKPLNPALLSDEKRLREVLGALLSAFCPARMPLRTFRVERMADYSAMRSAGGTLSFTSTSLAGFLPAYQDRRGIALMQFDLPAGTPVIHMAEALPAYAKAEEAEVLLPPYLTLRFAEQALLPEQQHILDADGNPPICFVQAVPGEIVAPEQLPAADGHTAGMRVFTALGRGEEPDAEDVVVYTAWKAAMTGALTEKSKLGQKK